VRARQRSGREPPLLFDGEILRFHHDMIGAGDDEGCVLAGGAVILAVAGAGSGHDDPGYPIGETGGVITPGSPA